MQKEKPKTAYTADEFLSRLRDDRNFPVGEPPLTVDGELRLNLGYIPYAPIDLCGANPSPDSPFRSFQNIQFNGQVLLSGIKDWVIHFGRCRFMRTFYLENNTEALDAELKFFRCRFDASIRSFRSHLMGLVIRRTVVRNVIDLSGLCLENLCQLDEVRREKLIIGPDRVFNGPFGSKYTSDPDGGIWVQETLEFPLQNGNTKAG